MDLSFREELEKDYPEAIVHKDLVEVIMLDCVTEDLQDLQVMSQ